MPTIDRDSILTGGRGFLNTKILFIRVFVSSWEHNISSIKVWEDSWTLWIENHRPRLRNDEAKITNLVVTDL